MRLQFRSRGQLLLHDLPLVKVADLYGDTIKNPWYAASAVEDDRLERVSFLLEIVTYALVLCLGFRGDLVDMEVLAHVRIARHQHAVPATEVCGVEHGNEGTRAVYLLGKRDSVKVCGDRPCGPTGFFRELYLRLLVADKGVPECF